MLSYAEIEHVFQFPFSIRILIVCSWTDPLSLSTLLFSSLKNILFVFIFIFCYFLTRTPNQKNSSAIFTLIFSFQNAINYMREVEREKKLNRIRFLLCEVWHCYFLLWRICTTCSFVSMSVQNVTKRKK